MALWPSREIDLEVVPAKKSDAGDFASHIVRHLAESGRTPDSHFAPVQGVNRDDVVRESERRWALSLAEPTWGRAWLLVARERGSLWSHGTTRVVGHAELRGPLVHASLHRADFSIGIEEAYRRAGQGQRLAEAAIVFARQTGRIRYVDLRVFASNARARRLYERLGFVETGRIEDIFRMPDGTRIDDVIMVLRI